RRQATLGRKRQEAVDNLNNPQAGKFHRLRTGQVRQGHMMIVEVPVLLVGAADVRLQKNHLTAGAQDAPHLAQDSIDRGLRWQVFEKIAGKGNVYRTFSEEIQ